MAFAILRMARIRPSFFLANCSPFAGYLRKASPDQANFQQVAKCRSLRALGMWMSTSFPRKKGFCKSPPFGKKGLVVTGFLPFCRQRRPVYGTAHAAVVNLHASSGRKPSYEELRRTVGPVCVPLGRMENA